MSVLAVGLSHRSSPVALLERATLDDPARLRLLTSLVVTEPITEAMVVAIKGRSPRSNASRTACLS
jgi:glutamyl-tRNA reductase